MRTLDSPAFLVLVFTGVVSLPLYLATVSIILTTKSLDGSFFKIYVATALVSCFSYLNRFIVIKIPLFSCGQCILEPFMYQRSYWFLQVSMGLHWHNMLVQLSLQCLIAFDRFVVIVLGGRWRKYWSAYYPIPVVLSYLLPWSYSYPLLLVPARFDYLPSTDNFVITSALDTQPLYSVLLVFMVSTTALSFLFNFGTFCQFYAGTITLSGQQRSVEMKLFINCLTQMVSEVVTLAFLVFQKYTKYTDPYSHDMTRVVIAYSSDVMSLFPPFVLFCTCQELRTKLLFFLRKRSTTSIDSTTEILY